MRASTKPASRNTRRCLDTEVCGILSRRSISPTERSDEARSRRMVRRLGSARIANEDSMRKLYLSVHIPVKSHSAAGRPRAGLREGPPWPPARLESWADMRPTFVALFAVIAWSDALPSPGPVWHDEFAGPAGASFDRARWVGDTGGSGFGNQERQFYTTRRDNVELD